MKLKSFMLLTALCSLFASAQIPYKVIAPTPEMSDGAVVYLMNYDTKATVDSATVSDHKAVFTGNVDEPFMAAIVCDGNIDALTIVEEGSSTINQQTKYGVGSMLNDQLYAITTAAEAIADKVNSASSQEEYEKYYAEYVNTLRQGIIDNPDTPIAYYLFTIFGQVAQPQDMLALVDQQPALGDYRRVQNLVNSANKTLLTSPGQMFSDFEAEYNGRMQRFSDYIGHGKYVLVDFWASWCGPCIRELKYIKELYAEYHDKGLDVLGVAVWDKPEDTEAAIKRLNIPWPCIINTQTIATDIYGISGIPCIILFGPDGKIISRGLREEALKADVAKYFQQ